MGDREEVRLAKLLQRVAQHPDVGPVGIHEPALQVGDGHPRTGALEQPTEPLFRGGQVPLRVLQSGDDGVLLGEAAHEQEAQEGHGDEGRSVGRQEDGHDGGRFATADHVGGREGGEVQRRPSHRDPRGRVVGGPEQQDGVERGQQEVDVPRQRELAAQQDGFHRAAPDRDPFADGAHGEPQHEDGRQHRRAPIAGCCAGGQTAGEDVHEGQPRQRQTDPVHERPGRPLPYPAPHGVTHSGSPFVRAPSTGCTLRVGGPSAPHSRARHRSEVPPMAGGAAHSAGRRATQLTRSTTVPWQMVRSSRPGTRSLVRPSSTPSSMTTRTSRTSRAALSSASASDRPR